MYKNKFVVVVKDQKGKVLRDTGNKVGLPFYEEYSLLLKNQHNKKAVANIYIDGEDVLNGRQLIIPANGEISLERFVESLDEGRKFQFVPSDSSRIKHKKDSGELGIIEIEFKKEKANNIVNTFWSNTNFPTGRFSSGMPTVRTMSFSCDTHEALPKSGGTAQGSRSEQEFMLGSVDKLEDSSTTIRLKLVPIDPHESKTVSNTKTVFCIDCGKKNPYSAKYCMKCGNRLIK